MDYQSILNQIKAETHNLRPEGNVASYIPELKNVNPDKFGIHLKTITGEDFAIGDSNEKFSIQSISKVFMLHLAFSMAGDSIWQRVGVEPSGNPFNSLIQLEFDLGIPRNPFINAGALVISDILLSLLKNPKDDYLNFIKKISNSPDVDINDKVFNSEKEYGFRNVAMANYLKSFSNIKNNVDEVLDFYFYSCSIEMTCKELANAFLIYANQGKSILHDEEFLNHSQIKRINALMQTCGFYDEAGEFTFRVGLPGKSGVGGGIAAVFPGKYSVAVWNPRLNEKGNSEMGMLSLELLTTKTGMSIF